MFDLHNRLLKSFVKTRRICVHLFECFPLALLLLRRPTIVLRTYDHHRGIDTGLDDTLRGRLGDPQHQGAILSVDTGR
jgi:hypothetical protein